MNVCPCGVEFWNFPKSLLLLFVGAMAALWCWLVQNKYIVKYQRRSALLMLFIFNCQIVLHVANLLRPGLLQMSFVLLSSSQLPCVTGGENAGVGYELSVCWMADASESLFLSLNLSGDIDLFSLQGSGVPPELLGSQYFWKSPLFCYHFDVLGFFLAVVTSCKIWQLRFEHWTGNTMWKQIICRAIRIIVRKQYNTVFKKNKCIYHSKTLYLTRY